MCVFQGMKYFKSELKFLLMYIQFFFMSCLKKNKRGVFHLIFKNYTRYIKNNKNACFNYKIFLGFPGLGQIIIKI